MADGVTFKMEGLEQTVEALGDLSRSTQKSVLRRVLLRAAEPTVEKAEGMAPRDRGVLALSIVATTQLTRRHKSEERNELRSEAEVYIGPASGAGALYYASHKEFGTILSPARPYMRPAWESTKGVVLTKIQQGLGEEVMKTAARAARKAARLAAGA
jgi:HK97 gp10 family phage protein